MSAAVSPLTTKPRGITLRCSGTTMLRAMGFVAARARNDVRTKLMVILLTGSGSTERQRRKEQPSWGKQGRCRSYTRFLRAMACTDHAERTVNRLHILFEELVEVQEPSAEVLTLNVQHAQDGPSLLEKHDVI